MNELLTLYQELSSAGVRFYTWDLLGDKAATVQVGDTCGIFMDLDAIEGEREELTVLAHEGGHVKTGATHKLSSPYDLIEKHEYKANKWAVQRLVSAQALDDAVAEGYTDLSSLAEHFNITEDLMRLVVCWYVHGNLSVEEYMTFL